MTSDPPVHSLAPAQLTLDAVARGEGGLESFSLRGLVGHGGWLLRAAPLRWGDQREPASAAVGGHILFRAGKTVYGGHGGHRRPAMPPLPARPCSRRNSAPGWT